MDSTFKDILRLPERLQSEIMRLSDEVEGLKASLLPAGIRYDKAVVQTSPDDPMSKIYAEIDTRQRRIVELCIDLAKAKMSVAHLIDRLDDDFDKAVLIKRYVLLLRPWEAAEELNCSVDTIYFRQRKAFKKFKALSNDFK